MQSADTTLTMTRWSRPATSSACAEPARRPTTYRMCKPAVLGLRGVKHDESANPDAHWSSGTRLGTMSVMALMHRGKVQGRTIVFSEPLAIPEGTEVAVRIEPLGLEAGSSGGSDGFATLTFFGMWADRHDMSDSASWVRKEREKWRDRLTRQD